MPKENFRYGETRECFQLLEEAARRAGVSRGQAFEDFLEIVVCTLGRPLMEDEYLQMVPKYSENIRGKRAIDSFTRLFAELVHRMTETGNDVLGDLFEGAITYGEKGQFLTPEPICTLMAQMQLPNEPTGLEGRKKVADPCTGSGRMLLAAGKLQPHWEFIGQDVDLRCVRMTAINLGLRNLYGRVLWGNSLGTTVQLGYETGRVEVWGNTIRKIDVSQMAPIEGIGESERVELPATETISDEVANRASQLRLFE